MLATFIEDIRVNDMIAPRRLAERLRLPVGRLARVARVNRNTMSAKPESPAIQAKLGEIAQIIARAAELCDDEGAAVIWFKFQPITGFGKTAEQLVEEGYAHLVLEDLEREAEGAYS